MVASFLLRNLILYNTHHLASRERERADVIFSRQAPATIRAMLASNTNSHQNIKQSH